MKPIRTAVIGAGKMGSLHSRIYGQMDQVDLVAIVDRDLEKAQRLVQQYGGSAFSDPAQILDKVDAVTIAAPTEFHRELAEPFLARRLGVLVEKPLAATLDDARSLLKLAQQNNCTLQVGYSERFNPVVQAMRRLNFTPRFVEVQRVSPYPFRSTDVGVVLDMMIHDIDIVLSLVQSKVKDVSAVGVNVLAQNEDIANVRLLFEDGCVANLTASRLALKTERKIRVFSEQAYLSLDYLKKTGLMVSKTANTDVIEKLREQHVRGEEFDLKKVDWTKMLNIQPLSIDDREPLQLEQEAFLQALRDGSRPQVSAEDAIAAMELAERIIQQIGAHRWLGDSETGISADQWHNQKPAQTEL